MKTYVSPMPSTKQAQAANFDERIRAWRTQTEQGHYEESLHSSYDAYLDAEDWDNALLQILLMENHVIPKYGKNSCEYATVLFKKGQLFKRACNCNEDRIEAMGLLIQSKKLYEQFGLKYSECWKCCMEEINELIEN